MPFWTTEDLPAHEQFSFWREVLCEAYITLNPVRRRQGRFSGSVTATLMSDVNVTRLLTERHVVERGPAEISKTPLEYYFVNLQTKGDVVARQRGREVLVRPNEFYLVDTTEPYHLDYRTDPETRSLRIPKRLLDPLLRDPVASTAIRVSRETAMGALAVDFLQSVFERAPVMPVSSHDAIAGMVVDLVALSLGGSAEAADVAVGSARQAMLSSVLKHVDDNLHDPALSIESVCRQFRISPRQLHRLFAAAEMTFGETIRAKRLERSAHALSQMPDQAVSSVAFACGFNDISYFNRSFRKKFEASPTEYRRANGRNID
ncbi:helix-turn-helix domain-containing protein [Rhodopseudomonas sp. HC1]|uniref:helix-turn-helix domain-containing protein n=1 Tax=Rhodopseudomonas infernalis TaxID=2897386 RepID=UPI001EE9758E|nr:helix-turn-helix domain-containing protein [Rhodopseudomonas infernalis]MCG6204542.1 helix-turn-helix domain-containing protein [Rhodopseudomonas infernalis]